MVIIISKVTSCRLILWSVYMSTKVLRFSQSLTSWKMIVIHWISVLVIWHNIILMHLFLLHLVSWFEDLCCLIFLILSFVLICQASRLYLPRRVLYTRVHSRFLEHGKSVNVYLLFWDAGKSKHEFLWWVPSGSRRASAPLTRRSATLFGPFVFTLASSSETTTIIWTSSGLSLASLGHMGPDCYHWYADRFGRLYPSFGWHWVAFSHCFLIQQRSISGGIAVLCFLVHHGLVKVGLVLTRRLLV